MGVYVVWGNLALRLVWMQPENIVYAEDDIDAKVKSMPSMRDDNLQYQSPS